MNRILVLAHSLFTGQDVISPGALVLEGPRVDSVGAPGELEKQGPFARVLGDTAGYDVIPGFVNGHNHNIRPNRPKLVESPLELSLLQLRRRRLPALSPAEEHDHTLWGALALLRTGVTSVIDCFSADPTRSDFGLSVSLDAYVESGIRAAVCVRCSDRMNFTYEDDEDFWRRLPGDVAELSRAKSRPFDADTFFTVCEAIARDYDGRDDRIRVGYGPTGEQWSSDDLLRRIAGAAEGRGAPVQIHLLESPFQAAAAEDRYGMTAVGHLKDLDFLGPTISLAHCVWANDQDMTVIRDSGSVVVNNPASNLRYGNGIAPVADMLERGVPVGLGLDANGFEPTFDMFREMRLAMLLQRRPGWNGSQMSALDALTMATVGGASAAAMPTQIGLLAKGSAADLILLNRNRRAVSPYTEPDQPLPDAVVSSDTPESIDYVVVAGRVVVERSGSAAAKFDALTSRVRESVARFLPLLDDADAEYRLLEPYVDAYFREIDLGRHGIRPGDRNLGSSTVRSDRS